MSTYVNILVERPRAGVGLIRLNRPQVLNALSADLLDELAAAAAALDADATIGCLVITGNEKAFSAGADIGKMAESSAFDMLNSGMIERWNKLRTVGKPILAAVSGHCLGGGCELAMICDIIIASESAKFGQPEINIGVIPGAGGTQRLTKAVGKSLAMEMVLTGRRLSADEALRYGLCSQVVPVDEHLERSLDVAAKIAAQAPLAVQMGKAAVNKSFEVGLQEGLEFEKTLFYFLFASDDQKEGMRAFMEKRAAVWTGR